MKSTRALCLIATATCLSACSIPVAVDIDCAWARPIKFSDTTKEWLRGHAPWPVPVRADLERVARHNDKHAAFCP